MTTTQVNPSRRLRDTAYTYIREALLSGNREFGSSLSEVELAAELGVSRTPVREALVRLTEEGLVAANPGGGHVVADLSIRVSEVLDVRMRLEPFAVGLTAHNITKLDYDLLAHIQEQIEAHAVNGGRLDEILRLNSDFHREIVDRCGNSYLIEMLDRMRPYSVFPRILEQYSDGELETAIREHREILDALWKRDHERAMAITYEHIGRGRDAIKQRFSVPRQAV